MPSDPLSRAIGDLLATTQTTSRSKNQKGFFREIEKLRQVYNLQSIEASEHKVLLNFKFPMAITKGRGTQACIKYE